MLATERTGLAYQKIKPEIGAAIAAGKEALLAGNHAADLRELLEQRGVLVFPEVHFTSDEQIAFTRTLGEYESDRTDGAPTDISLDPATGSTAEYTKASLFWHFDGYFNTVPILGSILSCVVPSPSGGSTQFCNTYAAWQALPDDRKTQIEGLMAVHALAGAQLSVDPEPSYATFAQWLGIRDRGTLAVGQRATPRSTSSGWIRLTASNCWCGCATGQRRSGFASAMTGRSVMRCCGITPAHCTGLPPIPKTAAG